MSRLRQQLKATVLIMGCALVAMPAPNVFAHCQVPCGIYDDSARIKSMLEDVATVEKAVSEMALLGKKKDPQSQNQMVRWIMNKEKHAQAVIDTISDYFLTQRVKTTEKDYSKRLMDHHAVIVAAMKVKQSAGTDAVKALRESVLVLAPYYPEHKHN